MAKLTERENILMVYEGKIPEWVPIGTEATQSGMAPSYLNSYNKEVDKRTGNIIYDCFGVMHEVTDPRIGLMPVADVYKITDLTKWQDQFPSKNWPNLDKLDWEYYSAKDTALWDRKNKIQKIPVGGNGSGSTYMWMATLMGHENAMVNMITEPDAWDELLDALTTWQENLIKKLAYYYKPDSIMMCDDNAFNKGLFMSPASYRARVKPFHARLAKTIAECGMVPEIHCCGKVDDIIDDIVEVGFRCWDPAQFFNDLEGIKARHGNKFILNGGWDSNGPAGIAGASEEVVRSAVRASMDRCAPGGGYVFTTSGMTLEWAVGTEHFNWIFDEAAKYGAEFYKK